MNVPLLSCHRRSLVRTIAGCASALLCCSPLPLAAQEAPAAATEAERPAIDFQVLETRRIDLRNRSIIYNKVVPPVLPEPPAPLPPPTAEQIAAAKAAAEAADRIHPPKKFEMLFLSTTVYDRSVTEIRWFSEKRESRVFSNIDFNYVAGLSWFETADTDYMLLMGIGNETAEDVEGFNQYAREQGWPKRFWKQVPPRNSFSLTRSEYAVVQDEQHTAPPETELAALDALHVYFDAHKERLIEEYHKREAANAAREQWLKDHPPIPKDTVINYWIEAPKRLPKARKEVAR